MKHKYQFEFLTREEVETLRQSELTERQIRIIDIMKSWSETRRDADGWFTLTTQQIADDIGVTKRSIEKDLILLRKSPFLSNKKTKVDGVNHLVNSYRLQLNGQSYSEINSEINSEFDSETYSEISHSNTNTYTNSTISNIYKSNNSITNKSISMRKMKGIINFTFDNFDLSFNYETIEELDQIADKAIEIDNKIKTSLSEAIEVDGTKQASMKSTSTEKPVTNTMTFNDRLGETWDEIDRELQELKNKPLSVATEMLCVGDNHYPRLVDRFKSFFEENSTSMSSKQYSICQSKLEALEKSIASKIENCHLYVGKSPEEIAHIKAVKNVEILGDRLSNSSSQEEFDGKREQLIDWCDKKCSENALSERDVEYVQAVLDKAKEVFRTNHENNSNTSIDEASLDDFIDGGGFISSISSTDIQSLIQPSESSNNYPFA